MATRKRVPLLLAVFGAICLATLLNVAELYPAPPATTNSKPGGAPEVVSDADAIHYHWHPNLFTNIMKDCIFDDDCRILNHHMFKTGGTTMERIFFRMLPPEVTDADFSNELLKNTNPKRIPQFDAHPHAYCEQAKFSSYQSTGDKFKEIVETCLEISKTQRYVTVFTYREPISRTQSLIHQYCNKLFDERSKELQQACTRCLYDDNTTIDAESSQDKEIWDGYANETNHDYVKLLHFNKHLKKELRGNEKSQRVEVLMMDTSDLDTFFQGLDDALKSSQQPNGKNIRVPLRLGTHRNKEKLEVCSFGMKSQMIKLMKPALEAYRSLTLSL